MILIHSQYMFNKHFYHKMKKSSTSHWILSYKSVTFILRSQFWTKCFLKYKLIGCMLSAGEKVINHEGAPKYEIKDQISFLIYFFWVIDPGTVMIISFS